jgi:hypothetical protein
MKKIMLPAARRRACLIGARGHLRAELRTRERVGVKREALAELTLKEPEN